MEKFWKRSLNTVLCTPKVFLAGFGWEAFVRDSSNYFYVQKRSSLKDYCPDYYDPTPGGVVAAGESFEETNRREIQEEMGIPSETPMSHLFTFYYADERVKCFGDAVVYDGPLRLQETEVASVEKMSMGDIISRYESGEKFTPDSLAACYEYIKIKGIPEVLCSPPTECKFY